MVEHSPGVSVGAAMGASVGSTTGASVGSGAVGSGAGGSVGALVGALVGASVGSRPIPKPRALFLAAHGVISTELSKATPLEIFMVLLFLSCSSRLNQ